MVNSLGLSAAGSRLPAQSSPQYTNPNAGKIVYTNQKTATSEEAPKPGKMAAFKSMLKKDEPKKRAPSIASTSTESPLLERNGDRKPTYNTAETMRGQFRFTSG